MGVSQQPEFSEKELRQWELLASFRQALGRQADFPQHPSWSDPRRATELADYLSLFLFGLFNPVLKTTRALCAASRMERVQRQVCSRPHSLGSFSEAQHLVNPAMLEKVFADLAGRVQVRPSADVRQAWQQWFARDSSLFGALPRMTWALYGGGKAGAKNNALRLHLSLHLLEDKPAQARISLGRECERKIWKEGWEKGAAYVGDRNFAQDYRMLGELQDQGCRYVLRLRENAVVRVEEELPQTEEDRAAGVQRQAWATLGGKGYRSTKVRVVWIAGKEGTVLLLVTNVAADQLSAAEVGLLYRRRWQIECFFRWVKCLLGCRHWLAESREGASLQIYLALIAALLFQLHTGRRPNKRMMELFQLHQMGWVSPEELRAGLQREAQAQERRKTKKK